MRTTFEIDDELIKEVMKASRTKTKKGAIVIAINEYLKSKKRKELEEERG